MPDTFQIGETVQLKSGGPIMTITAISADRPRGAIADCIWFVGDEQKTGTFPFASLQKASPGPTIA
jgi:uncharacterized protein YodC (DUF2158 family)